MTDDRAPAAVVLLRRPSDGWILALTRNGAWHDWHLPGGKWEPVDGLLPSPWRHTQPTPHNLAATAARELHEETGVAMPWPVLRPLVRYQSGSGRWVQAFVVHRHPSDFPGLSPFPATAAGQPAWVPPAMVVQPWCSLGRECRIILQAAGYRIGDLGLVSAVPPSA